MRDPFKDGPPPVSIGILLEDGMWTATCPECPDASYSHEDRDQVARWRGRHLIDRHGGDNFHGGVSDAQASRAARQQQGYRKRRRKGES